MSTSSGFTSDKAFSKLNKSFEPNISQKILRSIVSKYSHKYSIPIIVSSKFFYTEDVTDAYLDTSEPPYFKIYLHPIVKFYSESDLRRTIEHELEHLSIERKDWAINKKGIEYKVGRRR